MQRTLMGLTLILLAAAWPAGGAAAALPAELPGGETLPTLAPMLERTTPSVVNIATYTTVQVRNPLLDDPFFGRFFDAPNQRRYRRTRSAGSGVVVDAAGGYIVTNNHVVERADEITVTLADGRSLTAELVGVDPQVDLAVLKVTAEALEEIRFADSASVRVGDFVVAIGNPFGLNQTVTSGIVSALGRSGLGIEGFEDFIQTDASINPGNSGGALVDLSGRLVGINTAILAPTGSNVGIGFAIPANMVRAIMAQLIEHGEVQRGYPGVQVQDLNPELAEAFGVARRDGVVVVAIEPGSPAYDAGLRPGDIIVRVRDRVVRKTTDFDSQAAVIFVGDRVPVEVMRDGRTRELTLVIDDDHLEQMGGVNVDPRLAGTRLQNFRGDDRSSAGVLVTEVAADSLAWRYGLRPGDVLVAINQRAIQDLADLREGVRVNERQLLLRVYRDGRFGYVAIR